MASSFDTTLGSLGIARTATAPSVASSATTTLGQGDFLKLMTAQLRNQDPFEPVDNTQMVAQMAQFSSLAGISEMSSTLKAIAGKLGAASPADALAYVGKTVLTEGKVAYGRSAGGIAGAIELDAAASDVSVTITGADGQVLRQVSLGERPAGSFDYDWDGVTDQGTDAGTGPFTVTVTARDGNTPVTARNLVWAPVQSVSTTTGTAILTLPGLGEVPASAVRKFG